MELIGIFHSRVTQAPLIRVGKVVYHSGTPIKTLLLTDYRVMLIVDVLTINFVGRMPITRRKLGQSDLTV